MYTRTYIHNAQRCFPNDSSENNFCGIGSLIELNRSLERKLDKLAKHRGAYNSYILRFLFRPDSKKAANNCLLQDFKVVSCCMQDVSLS